MKNIKSHFRFNKQERSGIFFLLLIIVVLQVGFFAYRSLLHNTVTSSFSLDTQMQSQIDALKMKKLAKDSVKIYPFNPNFITDYKGYTLGMSVKEIDRLHTFRKNNRYVNSAIEFQRITKVSDSLLITISPYFKFPDWVKTTTSFSRNINKQDASKTNIKSALELNSTTQKKPVKDLNLVTEEELRTINGIGEKLASRIIKFRDRLGGFLVDEQIFDVYYLEPQVAKRVLVKFKVISQPSITKINVNTASASELSSLVYITYGVATKIVSYREENGLFSDLTGLKNIEGFPTNRINRIALYLSF